MFIVKKKSPVDTIFAFVYSTFLLFYKGCFKLSTVDIWGKTILYCGGCLVSYRMFSNITGLYPLDANTTKRSPDIAQYPLGRKIISPPTHTPTVLQ